TYVGANLTITKRPITVTADAKSKVYGDADPTLTYQVTSGSPLSGDTFSGALTRAAGEAAGNHAILQGTLALPDIYNLTYVGANLTITKRPIIVTADAKSKVYGDADPTLTYQITSGSLVFGDSFSGALTRAAGEAAGNHAILQGTLALSGNYNLTYVGANLTITKANPTCYITPYNLIYDGDPHAVTGACTGVNNEPLSGLDLSETNHTNAGDYSEDPWTFIDSTGNYTDTQGTVDDSIAKAAPTCTIDGYAGIYDGELYGATGSCTGVKGEGLTGLDLGDSFMDVPGGTAYWTFTDGTGNYNDNSGSVDIVISKADPTCSINGYTGIYDDELHGAAGSCTGVQGEDLTGLDLGDSFMDVPGGTAYWIFTDGTGNYNDNSGSVAIVISKADPTCSIDGYTGIYDGDPHGAAGSCTGVQGEDLTGLDLGDSFMDVPGGTAYWTLTGNCNYNDQSGEVAIVISTAEATCSIDGYTGIYDGDPHGASGSCTGVQGEDLTGLDLGDSFMDVPGGTAYWTLTGNGNYNDQSGEAAIVISKAEAVCDISGYSGMYDAAFHGASGSCSGIGGENPGTLDLGNTFKDVPGGTAYWTFTGNGNYNDQNGEAAIVIDKAEAVCECTPYTFEYDREEHTATGRCTGVEGEELTGLDLTGTTHIEIGDYTDDPWIFTDVTGNYRDANGTVNDEITLRTITVTADAKSKVIGQTDPALTFQITSGELLSGDAFVGELTRQPGENVGIYAILQGTLTLPDYYEITYVGAYFTITGSMIYLPLIHR
ncbi:MAG: MBG domain-containing protein, partial [Anaerolineales bacterium]